MWAQVRILLGAPSFQPIRRVSIPKPGGERVLGIPTVHDCLIQQALHQVLSPMLELTFADHSYGLRLNAKRIKVTGGANGLGLATVERCLLEGASVVLADLATSEGAQEASRLDGKYSSRCLFLPVDVTSTAEVDALVDKTVSELGGLDGVFNNAGIGGLSAAVDYPDDDYLRVIDINLNGVFRVARASLRQMYKQGSGLIINCTSILGVVGQSNAAAYSADKGGVVNMTRTLALEAAAKGVRVNSIGLGYIDTPLLKDLKRAQASLDRRSLDKGRLVCLNRVYIDNL